MAALPSIACEVSADVVVRVLGQPRRLSAETTEALAKFPLELARLDDPSADDGERALRHVAHAFGLFARELAEDLPEGEEKAVAFRMLLESRDWAVRAMRAAAAA